MQTKPEARATFKERRKKWEKKNYRILGIGNGSSSMKKHKGNVNIKISSRFLGKLTVPKKWNFI